MIEQAPSTLEVKKPWGRFEQYTHNTTSTVKVIIVDPGESLSLQYHYRRDELWVVLDRGARVEVGNNVLEPAPGEKVFIPRLTKHRLSSVGKEPTRILEISLGQFDEGDIVRLDDVYGRAPVPAPEV